MSASRTQSRPVVAGLFEEQDGRVHLIGTRCNSCGTLYFPQTVGCRNPDCLPKAIESVALPSSGLLHSFTVQRYAPPSAFRIDDWAPYAIGVVDLGGGLHVMGMLTSISLDGIEIGMRFHVVEAPLFIDDDGPVTTYMFAPGGEG
jgi:uncharacterized OB-fold protein